MTARGYCDFLQTVLPGLLEDAPLTVRQRLWFQHDGTPEHYGENVRQWLNATCPVRSLDLSPVDFSCGGYLKEHVHAVPPRTIEDLVARLQAAVTSVDACILSRAAQCSLL
jgi:hypothetical protein